MLTPGDGGLKRRHAMGFNELGHGLHVGSVWRPLLRQQ